MRSLVISFAVAFICLAHPIAAKSVQAEFSEVWADRATRYGSDMAQAKTAFDNAFTDLNETSARSMDRNEVLAKLNALYARSQAYGYAAARADILGQLQRLMALKPSAERADVWMQERVDQLKRSAEQVQQQAKDADAMQVGPNVSAAQVIGERGKAFFTLGTVLGTADELRLIDDNLRPYFEAKARQDGNRRRSWAAILGGLGQALKEGSQPPPSSNWSATCTTTGMFTNCHGN